MAEHRRNIARTSTQDSSSSSEAKEKLYPDLDKVRAEGDASHFSPSKRVRTTAYEAESEHSSLDDNDAPKLDRRSSFKDHKRISSSAYYSPFLSKESTIVGCLIAALLMFLLLYFRPVFNETALPTPFESYRQQMGRMLKEKYPKEETNTKNILRLIGEKWISEEPKEPYVILIAGQKAKNFAADIVSVFSNVTQKGEVDTLYCTPYKQRKILDDEIAYSLSKKSKTVILNDINKLRGDAPLCLHSLCDVDYSPYPTALVILTVDGSQFGGHPECEQPISSLLMEEWKSDFMNEDRISPILSRIMSYVICLKD